MLTSQTEKFLSKEYEDDRIEALKDSSNFSSDELTDLGVGVEGGGVNDPETYLIDNTPVDNNTLPNINSIDIRALPGHD
jgi:hypothetical protein